MSNGYLVAHNDLAPELLPFWKICKQLYHDGELVIFGSYIIVPTAVHQDVLACLHDSHHGVEATKRSRQTVWWFGINSDIVNAANAYEPCQILMPSPATKSS